MCMVRSPKSIGGIFGLALGNAPYSYSYWNNSLQGKRILPIIEKIKAEGQELNLLPKKSKLPV